MSALALSLSACTTTPPNGLNVPYQANLLNKCPEKLPRLNGQTGKDAGQVLTEYPEIYGDCAARHNQLVTEIKQRGNAQ
ncbi:hypothetical protein AB7X03_14200 [Providencia rettgeri]